MNESRSSSDGVAPWLALSLVVGLGLAIWGVWPAVVHPDVIQDDARQHAVWTLRYLDPEVLGRDLASSYFQSVAPAGYAALYWTVAKLGINPLKFNAFLPLALGLVTTLFAFRLGTFLASLPVAGWWVSVFLNLNLWLKDDLVSATPRAFVYPLGLWLLDALARKSNRSSLAALIVLGLFYPPVVPVFVGVWFLSLWEYRDRWIHPSHNRRDWHWFGAACVAGLLVLIVFRGKAGQFGPVVGLDEARNMAEFGPVGRTRFFAKDTLDFWIWGDRTGLLPREWKFCPLILPQLWVLGLIPVWWWLWRKGMTAVSVVQPSLLVHFVVVSTGLFGVAHAILFKLYLPSRFTQHTFRIVIALLAGIVVAQLGTILSRQLAEPRHWKQGVGMLLVGGVGIYTCLFPILVNRKIPGFYPGTRQTIGTESALYDYFRSQPKGILIASLAEETNNLPAFAGRSILVGRECAIPYHSGYYRQVRERISDLLRAHYTPDETELNRFIQKYGITHILIERRAFTPKYLTYNVWFQQYQPAASEALNQLKQGLTPALTRHIASSTVFETERYVVIATERVPQP